MTITSCTNKEIVEQVEKTVHSKTLNVVTESQESRSVLSYEGTFYWTENDYIGVYGSETENARFHFISQIDGVSNFTGNMNDSGEAVKWAYFPYSEKVDVTKKQLSFPMLAERTISNENHSPMIGRVEANNTVRFYHMGGILHLKIVGLPEHAAQLVITSEGENSPCLAGTAVVDDITVDGCTYRIDNGSKEVVYDVRNLDGGEYVYSIYMPLQIGTYEKIKVTLKNEVGGIIKERSLSNLIATRGKMTDTPMLHFEAISLTGSVSSDMNFDGYSVLSVFGKSIIKENGFKIDLVPNGKVQTFFLTDGQDKVCMLSRLSDTSNNKLVTFNVETTATAYVTLHPFFAHMDNVAYDILCEAIQQCEHYSTLRAAIEKIILQKKDIYSSDNVELLDAMGLLLDEMIVFTHFKPEPDSQSRVVTNDTSFYPFRLNSHGGRLDLQVFGLNPNYYGTATHANGSVERLVVQSHEDFGFLALLESIRNILIKRGWDANQYGEIESYTFPAEGECIFHFSCNTQENQLDLLERIVSTFSDIVGIDIDDEVAARIISNLDQFMDDCDLLMSTYPYFDTGAEQDELIDMAIDRASELIEEGIEQVYDSEIEDCRRLRETTNNPIIKNAYNDRISRIEESRTLFSKAMNSYTVIKGIGNTLVRIIAAQRATDPIDFRLCYYNNEIFDCGQIRKYKGDGQTGFYGKTLKTPISVMVNVNGEPTTDYVVKFQVSTGGGSVKEETVDIRDYIASTEWTLGTEGERQTLQAFLCERERGNAVCDPVEFVAYAIESPYIIRLYSPDNGTEMELGETIDVYFQITEYDTETNTYLPCEHLSHNVDFETDGDLYEHFLIEKGGLVHCSWTPKHTMDKLVANIYDDDDRLLSSATFTPGFTSEPFDELTSLQTLYHSAGGNNWVNNTYWLTESKPENWYGVRMWTPEDIDEMNVLEQTNLPYNYWVRNIDVKSNNLTGDVLVEGFKLLYDINVWGNPINSLTIKNCRFNWRSSFITLPEKMNYLHLKNIDLNEFNNKYLSITGDTVNMTRLNDLHFAYINSSDENNEHIAFNNSIVGRALFEKINASNTLFEISNTVAEKFEIRDCELLRQSCLWWNCFNADLLTINDCKFDGNDIQIDGSTIKQMEISDFDINDGFFHLIYYSVIDTAIFQKNTGKGKIIICPGYGTELGVLNFKDLSSVSCHISINSAKVGLVKIENCKQTGIGIDFPDENDIPVSVSNSTFNYYNYKTEKDEQIPIESYTGTVNGLNKYISELGEKMYGNE